MSEPGSISRRVADSIPAATTHAWVAERIGLTAEKLSKSLNGRRAFSAVELAAIAELLNADVFWLITGRPSPLSTDSSTTCPGGESLCVRHRDVVPATDSI